MFKTAETVLEAFDRIAMINFENGFHQLVQNSISNNFSNYGFGRIQTWSM